MLGLDRQGASAPRVSVLIGSGCYDRQTSSEVCERMPWRWSGMAGARPSSLVGRSRLPVIFSLCIGILGHKKVSKRSGNSERTLTALLGPTTPSLTRVTAVGQVWQQLAFVICREDSAEDWLM